MITSRKNHSIAGEELTSIGSRFPEKVAGLVYLDAAYPYAYYDQAHGSLDIDMVTLQQRLDQLKADTSAQSDKAAVDALLQTELPQIERDLKETQNYLAAFPLPPPYPPLPEPTASIVTAIYAGEQKYTSQIHVPILAIYALPHDLASDHPNDPKAQAVDERLDFDKNSPQAEAFERAQPTAHVIRLSHANHWVFLTNEVEVIRDINAFIVSLPQ